MYNPAEILEFVSSLKSTLLPVLEKMDFQRIDLHVPDHPNMRCVIEKRMNEYDNERFNLDFDFDMQDSEALVFNYENVYSLEYLFNKLENEVRFITNYNSEPAQPEPILLVNEMIQAQRHIMEWTLFDKIRNTGTNDKEYRSFLTNGQKISANKFLRSAFADAFPGTSSLRNAKDYVEVIGEREFLTSDITQRAEFRDFFATRYPNIPAETLFQFYPLGL